MTIEDLLKLFSGLLALNIAIVLLTALRGGRGRFLVWGVQTALLWLWLTLASLALFAIRHRSIFTVVVIAAAASIVCRMVWVEFVAPPRSRRVQNQD